jgi:hypothetical protein
MPNKFGELWALVEKKKNKTFIENNLITVRGNAKGGKLVYMISLERENFIYKCWIYLCCIEGMCWIVILEIIRLFVMLAMN